MTIRRAIKPLGKEPLIKWQMPQMRGNFDSGIVISSWGIPIPWQAFDRNEGNNTGAQETGSGAINIVLPHNIILERCVFLNWQGDKHGAGLSYTYQVFADANRQIVLTNQIGAGGNNAKVEALALKKVKTKNINIYITGFWPSVREIYLYGKKV